MDFKSFINDQWSSYKWLNKKLLSITLRLRWVLGFKYKEEFEAPTSIIKEGDLKSILIITWFVKELRGSLYHLRDMIMSILFVIIWL